MFLADGRLNLQNITQAKNYIGAILRNRNIPIDGGHAGNRIIGKCSHFFYRNTKTGQKYWIKFDFEDFLTFGKQFREYNNTVGETINAYVVDNLTDGDLILFARPDTVYYVSVKEFRENMRDRINESEGERTYSIPLQILKRWDRMDDVGDIR